MFAEPGAATGEAYSMRVAVVGAGTVIIKPEQ